MPTSRFVISSYDIAANDENLNSESGLGVTRFTDINSLPKSRFFKKSGRRGFKMNSSGALTMGAGSILGSGNASTVKYDTFTIEFPYYFYKSASVAKKVEIEKIHLFQRKTSTEIDHTERTQTQKTSVLTNPIDGTTTTTSTTETVTNTVYGDDKYKKIDATVHSSLARFITNFDRFVCTSNTDYYENPREFLINDGTKEFDFWCYTLNGEIIDVDPQKTIIICEFKLTY